MIVAERKQKTILDRFDKFGEAMPDGRLTAPSDGKVYRLREAYLVFILWKLYSTLKVRLYNLLCHFTTLIVLLLQI